ncbi:MAG: efflux RND transporter periplasmic adaptor subunit [Sphingobacterium hotanense]
MNNTMELKSKTSARICLFCPILLAASFVLSCNGNEESQAEEVIAFRSDGKHIQLSERSNIAARLTIETVKEESYTQVLRTSGVVQAVPTAYAAIAPSVAGRIVKSYVQLGQKVHAGSPLFELSSGDYFNAEKEYFDTKHELVQAEINYKRQQDLLQNKVSSQKDLEEAETEFKLKKSAFENASAALKIFQVDPKNIRAGEALIVRSPIAGEIISNNIVLGQHISEDADPVAVVAELSKVWIAGQVKEKDIAAIKQQEEVEIQLSSGSKEPIKGTVAHINQLVNPDTRSIEVLIACDNTDGKLKPGMYSTVHFKANPQYGILIPSAAVFQQADNEFVFVNNGNLQFEKREIESAGTLNGKVLIQAGLRPGEKIVVAGGSLINTN